MNINELLREDIKKRTSNHKLSLLLICIISALSLASLCAAQSGYEIRSALVTPEYGHENFTYSAQVWMSEHADREKGAIAATNFSLKLNIYDKDELIYSESSDQIGISKTSFVFGPYSFKDRFGITNASNATFEYIFYAAGQQVANTTRIKGPIVQPPSMTGTPDFSEEAGIKLEGLNYGPFDKEGIPMHNFQGGLHYNPLVITYYASGYLKEYQETREGKYFQAYFKMLDWLIKNGKPFKNDSIIWVYNYDVPPYVNAPWYSALTQGRIMQVFLDAYKFNGEQKYRSLAEKSLNGMLVPSSEGGVFYQDNRGDTWVQEAPSLTPSFILNGDISAIVSLDYYFQQTKDQEIKKIVSQLVDSVARKLPLFDVPDKRCSRYDLYGHNTVFALARKGDYYGPSVPLPVDRMTLDLPVDPSVVIDIGQKDDMTTKSFAENGKIVPQGSWGQSYVLDSRTVRNYEKKEGSYGRAEAWLFPNGNILPGEKYKFTIDYKDVTSEEFCLRVYYPQKRDGVEVECFQGKGDGLWKSKSFELSPDLFVGGLGRLECADSDYHKMHQSQMVWLYDYSKKEIFNHYSRKWKEYLD